MNFRLGYSFVLIIPLQRGSCFYTCSCCQYRVTTIAQGLPSRPDAAREHSRPSTVVMLRVPQ